MTDEPAGHWRADAMFCQGSRHESIRYHGLMGRRMSAPAMTAQDQDDQKRKEGNDD